MERASTAGGASLIARLVDALHVADDPVWGLRWVLGELGGCFFCH